MELDYITVKGFKSLKDIERLHLKRLNVLVGANGSGKSNFVEVFGFLRAVTEARLQEYVAKAGGANKILHFGSKETSLLEIKVSFSNEVNAYTIGLSPTDQDSLYPRYESVHFWDKSYKRPYEEGLEAVSGGREAGISAPNLVRTPSWVQIRLKSWRIYHLHDTSGSSPMKKPSELEDNRFLRPDCSNIASFLFMLKQLHFEAYELIRKSVQRVAPYFEDFVLEPSLLNNSSIRLAWKHKRSEEYFDSSSLSDGSLRFIGLATLLLQPAKFMPSVVLVDEPELGLHPFAVQVLAALIRQASEHSQILIATQSPQLLDNFDPDDILVADRYEDSTEIRRLDGAPLVKWLEEYSLGQLWEKNEFCGRPN